MDAHTAALRMFEFNDALYVWGAYGRRQFNE